MNGLDVVVLVVLVGGFLLVRGIWRFLFSGPPADQTQQVDPDTGEVADYLYYEREWRSKHMDGR